MTQPQSPRNPISVWLATGLGVGFVPVAPGTVGTLWGIPLTLAVSQLHYGLRLCAVSALAAVGVRLCRRAAEHLGEPDPKVVVWDELASLPLVFLFLTPTQIHQPHVLIAGFLLYRFFDITKLPPARQCERLPGGWGVMADDWVAGIYAGLCLHALVGLGVV